MNVSRKGLAIAFATTLGVGLATNASADVYGAGYLLTDELSIIVTNGDGSAPIGGAGGYVFSTDSNASLNFVADPTDGSASCFGNVSTPFTNCSVVSPVLSGTVQNAPGGGLARGESDYTLFGANGIDYSNAESEITNATLVNGQPTRAEQIAEANLVSGVIAAANTNVQSNTALSFEFTVGEDDGIFTIDFEATIAGIAEVTAPSEGLAQANTGWTLRLTDADGNVIVNWAPDGVDDNVATCGVGLICTDEEEDELSLNNTFTSVGPADELQGSGEYSLTVEGLSSGSYQLALAATTSTQLVRFPVPVPGTLLLMGAGLLMAGGLRRRK